MILEGGRLGALAELSPWWEMGRGLGTQRHVGGGGGVVVDARCWSDDAWRHSRGEDSLRLAGLLLRKCGLSLAHYFDLVCDVY